MILTVLGSGTCIPRPQRASPGFVIEFEDSVVLVDPSAGSLQRLEANAISVSRISHVCFSHLHPDHTGDLAPLLFAAKYGGAFLPGKLTLLGPTGLADFYERLCFAYQDWTRLTEDRLEILEDKGTFRSFPDWSVQSARVQHTPNSLGFRFQAPGGAVLAYSGDTEPCESLIHLLDSADLALVESSFPSSQRSKGHLTPELAGEAALRAGVKRLLLTHLYPACENEDLISEVRSSGFSGCVEVASDGQRIALTA